MRAPGAEIGNAGGKVGRVADVALGALKTFEPLGDILVGLALQQPLRDRDGDVVGIERALGREKLLAVFVLLADDGWRFRNTVELLADLGFHERALFLDHNDQVEAFGELRDHLRHHRPGHRHLEQPDAELGRRHFIDAEFIKCLAHIEIALACRNDADLRRTAAAQDDLVQLVGPRKGNGGKPLVIVQPGLGLEPVVTRADVEPALRHVEIVRRDDFDPVD